MREVCADCGNIDPTWASLNRGILLCQECCSIHRSMGRHVSWVRSLQQGWWSPTLLRMIEALSTAGANSIWEYTLLDRTSTSPSCKPTASDPVHAAKEEFIRNKYEDLTYILRGEQEADGPEGLGAQLHAAARTGDLLTSLRLFSQGADPNFYHEEKGSCPLHVTAKTNQTLQAELLLIYGADLNRRDSAGRTPEDVAKDSGHLALAERLRTARFHVFDRLVQYLCLRKTGMGNGLEELCLEFGEVSPARTKLESLSNSQFEKLVADIYDELDRREAGLAWQQQNGNQIVDPAAFLPPHPELSATRNQYRQKLARLTTANWELLLRDVLRDARRRDTTLALEKKTPSPAMSAKLKQEISDDEPLYDSVASDDDYASTNGGETYAPIIQNQPAIASHAQTTTIQADENLRKSLKASEATIARLESEVRLLNGQLAGLVKENRELREEVTKCRSFTRCPEDETAERIRGARPTSMYEARNRPKIPTVQLPPVWPTYNEVIQRTEMVTKRIQELCAAMKNLDLFILAPCAVAIRVAVEQLTEIFPLNPSDEIIRELTSSSRRLELECACARTMPYPNLEPSLQKMRDLAYDIAKATKQLVLRSETPN